MSETAKPPVGIWVISLFSTVISLMWGTVVGGSPWGYLFGILGTISCVVALFIDRTRRMNPNYDYGKKWFRKGVTAVYWVSTAGVILHIIRYSIAVAAN